MFQAVRQDAEGKSLDPVDRLLPRLSVDQDTWERRNLGNPAPVFFLFKFDRQAHSSFDLLRFRSGAGGGGSAAPSGTFRPACRFSRSSAIRRPISASYPRSTGS